MQRKARIFSAPDALQNIPDCLQLLPIRENKVPIGVLVVIAHLSQERGEILPRLGQSRLSDLVSEIAKLLQRELRNNDLVRLANDGDTEVSCMGLVLLAGNRDKNLRFFQGFEDDRRPILLNPVGCDIQKSTMGDFVKITRFRCRVSSEVYIPRQHQGMTLERGLSSHPKHRDFLSFPIRGQVTMVNRSLAADTWRRPTGWMASFRLSRRASPINFCVVFFMGRAPSVL